MLGLEVALVEDEVAVAALPVRGAARGRGPGRSSPCRYSAASAAPRRGAGAWQSMSMLTRAYRYLVEPAASEVVGLPPAPVIVQHRVGQAFDVHASADCPGRPPGCRGSCCSGRAGTSLPRLGVGLRDFQAEIEGADQPPEPGVGRVPGFPRLLPDRLPWFLAGRNASMLQQLVLLVSLPGPSWARPGCFQCPPARTSGSCPGAPRRRSCTATGTAPRTRRRARVAA